MSKLKEHLNEMKYNALIQAWEQSHIESRKLKDTLGLMMTDPDHRAEYEELYKIIAGLDKYYVQNAKNVRMISKKLEK